MSSRVLFYKDMQAVINRRPQRLPAVRAEGRGRPRSILWMRETPLLDSGVDLRKKPEPESMVACFDPPSEVKLENPFPSEFFVPGRTIFMAGAISAEVAKIVREKIHEKAEQDPHQPVILWIDSPGGSVEAGLMIKEAMEAVRPAVSTIAIGGVSSMAALLAAFGRKGYRLILENATLMYHEVRYASRLVGAAQDMEDAAQELLRSTDRLLTFLAAASGNTLGALKESIAGKDRFFAAKNAVRAGFVDGVLRPVRYYGPANPWGVKVESYRSPLQRRGKRIIDLPAKIESAGEPAAVVLKGVLNDMQSYRIIAALVSHIALNPKSDVRLEIKDSPGGEISEALGVLDLVTLINALPNCGDVITRGSGELIGGMSTLLLSAGKAGKREMHSSSRLALRDVVVSVPPYASATRVEESSDEAARIFKLITNRLSKNSALSPEAVRAMIAQGREGKEIKGCEMLAEDAAKHKFIDKAV